MKKLILLLCALAIFSAPLAFASATDVWISQTAQTPFSGGGNCNGQNTSAITFFNTSGNWGAGSTQIGAGTVVHLCGTITTQMAFQGGGGAGNPVELLFETGANVSISPGCNSSGCVNTGGSSNILIDGGASQPCGWNVVTNVSEGTCNGIVRSMQYGSSNGVCPAGTCTTQPNSSVGNLIQGCGNGNCSGGSNIEIRNLEVGPSYVHTSSGAGLTDSGGTQGVFLTNGSNWNIHDMKCHDAVWCIVLAYNSNTTIGTWTVANNDLYNDSHMTAYTGGGASPSTLNGLTMTGNYCHDMSNWDTTADDNHANCIHIYGNGAGTGYKNVVVANNYMGGNMGADATGHIFIEAANGSAQNVMVYNNVMFAVGGLIGGERLLLFNDCTLGGCVFLNNTLEGNSSSNGACMFIGANGSTNTAMAQVENNAVDNCNIDGESDIVTYTTINFNLYGNTGTRFRVNSSDVTFAGWKSGTGDGSSSANIASLGLNTSTLRPNPGSALIGAGTNLTSLCTGLLTGLCTDISGVARPASGAWNIGAFEPGGGTPTVNIPTFSPVAGSYSGTQSITISTTTGAATICYTTDGSTPTANGSGTCTHGTTYTSPVSVATSLTLKAVGSESGFLDSAVGSAAYVIGVATVATPTFSPVAGTYTSTQTVTISTITFGATICWTNDGTTPTANGAGACTHGTTYVGTVSVTVNQTLRAIGSLSGDTDSSVGTAAYVLKGSAPTFSPVAGSYSSAQTVSLTQAQGLSMCYTTNGSTPVSTAGSCTTGTLYSGAISVSFTQTVKAIGFANGWTDSNVGSAAYTITILGTPANSVGAFGVKLSGGAKIK